MSQEADRKDAEKLENLYRDGILVEYLKNSKCIVLMEAKMSYA